MSGLPALLGPLLETLEARAALLVEHDDLAVEHQVAEGQQAQGPRELGIARRRVLAAPVAEARLAGLARAEDAEAVVLQLEDPARIAEGPLRHLREHELHRLGPHVATGRFAAAAARQPARRRACCRSGAPRP